MSEQVNQKCGSTPDLTPGTSYHNPARVGVTVKTRIERGEAYAAPEIYNVEITVLEILRGNGAWERIQTQGSPIGSPKAGFEYVLARLRLGYLRRGRGGGNQPFQITEGQFAIYSPDDNREETAPSLPPPHPYLNGNTLAPGESREGWILLQAPKELKKLLLVFKRQNVEGVHGIWGNLWFQL